MEPHRAAAQRPLQPRSACPGHHGLPVHARRALPLGFFRHARPAGRRLLPTLLVGRAACISAATPAARASSSPPARSLRLVASSSTAGPSGPLASIIQAAQQQQQQQQQQQASDSLAAQLDVCGLTYHPAATERPLISDVNFSLPLGQLGLIIGRSGSGKTTLLQVLAGLCEQDAGAVTLTRASAQRGTLPAPSSLAAPAGGGAPGAAPAGSTSLTMEQRMQQVGLVFQFPERHFLGEDIFQELTFAWPKAPQYAAERHALTARVQQVIRAVRLEEVPLSRPPTALSGGQQRRLALAIQLVRRPSLLLLDEPLAGLDWQARAEVVSLLRELKQKCTLLVVSHDMREVAPLVDRAWRMHTGGTLEPEAWPPADLSELLRAGRKGGE